MTRKADISEVIFLEKQQWPKSVYLAINEKKQEKGFCELPAMRTRNKNILERSFYFVRKVSLANLGK